jgi:hypothetical protein
MAQRRIHRPGLTALFALLALATLGACSTPNQGTNPPTPPPTGAAFARMQGLPPGGGASLEVDAKGGLSIAYNNAGGGQLWYAHCASGCEQPSNWKSLKLSADNVLGSSPVLQLDAAGNPRIVWVVLGGLNPNQAVYLECNSACTDNVANWGQAVRVTTVDGRFAQFAASNNPTFFALDGQGRPGFVVHDNGTLRYASCQGSCRAGANWQVTDLGAARAGSSALHASLVYTAAGAPRAAVTLADANNLVSLHYLACTAGCTATSGWTDTTGAPVGTWLRLRLDRQDRPRLLYFAGALVGNPDSNKLFYSACDAGCDAAANWRRAAVGVPDGSGNQGLDFALDANGVPRLVYDTRANNDPQTPVVNTRLEYALCASGDCTATPTWTRTVVEDGVQQSADNALRALYKAQCRYGIDVDAQLEPLFSLSIFVGQEAHLALNAAGQAVISADYAPTFNCGDGVVRTGGILPTVYLPR